MILLNNSNDAMENTPIVLSVHRIFINPFRISYFKIAAELEFRKKGKNVATYYRVML